MLEPSSPTRPDSVRVLNRVPMGSRGCPTQPSMLVMEVWPLWSNSKTGQSRQGHVFFPKMILTANIDHIKSFGNFLFAVIILRCFQSRKDDQK